MLKLTAAEEQPLLQPPPPDADADAGGAGPSSANAPAAAPRAPRLLALPHGCRTNRFFAMVRVCRKVCLAVLLDACTRLHPAHFAGLAPRTWWVGKAAIGWEAQLEAHREHCEAEAQAALRARDEPPDAVSAYSAAEDAAAKASSAAE